MIADIMRSPNERANYSCNKPCADIYEQLHRILGSMGWDRLTDEYCIRPNVRSPANTDPTS